MMRYENVNYHVDIVLILYTSSYRKDHLHAFLRFKRIQDKENKRKTKINQKKAKNKWKLTHNNETQTRPNKNKQQNILQYNPKLKAAATLCFNI